MTEDDEEAAELLANYFGSVFVEEAKLTDEMEKEQTCTSTLNILFEEKVVQEKLLKLHPDKSQGPDNVHPMVLKNCAAAVCKPLTAIF